MSPVVVLVAAGAASPVNGKLLSLVPPGCAIVAGFENGHGPHAGGRLLLTTPNNRFDLDDWLGLAGVDTERRYDEVIEAAAWNARGELNEHLLLVAGRFDRERIFRAARQNGALTSPDTGETVLVIRPFQREQKQMPDVRWLAILDNRTALLGTPVLVQEALQPLCRACGCRPGTDPGAEVVAARRQFVERARIAAVIRPERESRQAALGLGASAGRRRRTDRGRPLWPRSPRGFCCPRRRGSGSVVFQPESRLVQQYIHRGDGAAGRVIPNTAAPAGKSIGRAQPRPRFDCVVG